MSAIKNLSKAVPPKARALFVVSIAVMVIILVIVWKELTKSNSVDIPSVETGARLESSISKIEKPRLDQQTILPETSPMMQELEKDKEEKIEAAIAGEESYIEGLRFRQQARQEERAPTTAGSNSPKAETGIDDIIAKRDRERSQASNNATNNAQPVSLFDEEAFLKKELETAQRPIEDMTKFTSDLFSKTGFLASNNFTDSSRNNDFVSQATGTQGDPYTSQYMAKYNSNSNKSASSKGERDFSSQVTQEGGDVEMRTLNRGSRYYGVLNIGINTDEISPTTATVLEGGPLIGAEFLSETPARVGEKSVVIFDSMSVGGADYSVRAIALDPETNRSGLADSVNRHILERYLKLGIAAFVDGYAESLQDSTTTVSSEGSTTTQTSAVPDGATQTKIAIGKVGEAFVPQFEDEFKRPPTVEVNAGREVVIMLLDPIEIPKEDVVNSTSK